MNNETKNLKYIIGFFLVLSIVAAYYIGFMSAKLGLNAPFITGNTPVAKAPAAQAPEPKMVEEVAPLELKGDEVTVGDKNAKMVLVVYTDFQCPFCARFHPVLSSVFSKNSDSKLVFKHYPLPFHQYAKEFATMFECIAKNKGNELAVKFADDIFTLNMSLGGNITSKDANDLFIKSGISQDALSNCKNDSTISKKIADSTNEGSQLGIQGTPALYIINTQTSKAVRINGALDESTVQAEFDKLK